MCWGRRIETNTMRMNKRGLGRGTGRTTLLPHEVKSKKYGDPENKHCRPKEAGLQDSISEEWQVKGGAIQAEEQGRQGSGKGLSCYLVSWRILCIEGMQSDFLFTKVTLVWSRHHRCAKQEAEGPARRLLRSSRDRRMVDSSRVEVWGGKRRQWL